MVGEASRVLAITGMHRSGTSLMAGWLAYCGLQVGDELVKGEYDNPLGHYEDIHFMALHESVLEQNGLTHQVSDNRELTFSDEHRARAEALIEGRRPYSQWGWKDPRTTLFLDVWKELIPDLKVLGIYRHYSLVVESLLRRELRGREFHAASPRPVRSSLRLRYTFANLPRVHRLLRVWRRYNQALLEFALAHPQDTLILHIDDLLMHAMQLIDFLNRGWGFELQAASLQSVYQPELLATGRRPLKTGLSSLLASEVMPLYRRLERSRVRTLARLAVQAA